MALLFSDGFPNWTLCLHSPGANSWHRDPSACAAMPLRGPPSKIIIPILPLSFFAPASSPWEPGSYQIPVHMWPKNGFSFFSFYRSGGVPFSNNEGTYAPMAKLRGTGAGNYYIDVGIITVGDKHFGSVQDLGVSPSSTAVVLVPLASEPAEGSVMPKAPSLVPSARGFRWF